MCCDIDMHDMWLPIRPSNIRRFFLLLATVPDAGNSSREARGPLPRDRRHHQQPCREARVRQVFVSDGMHLWKSSNCHRLAVTQEDAKVYRM